MFVVFCVHDLADDLIAAEDDVISSRSVQRRARELFKCSVCGRDRYRLLAETGLCSPAEPDTPARRCLKAAVQSVGHVLTTGDQQTDRLSGRQRQVRRCDRQQRGTDRAILSENHAVAGRRAAVDHADGTAVHRHFEIADRQLLLGVVLDRDVGGLRVNDIDLPGKVICLTTARPDLPLFSCRIPDECCNVIAVIGCVEVKRATKSGIGVFIVFEPVADIRILRVNVSGQFGQRHFSFAVDRRIVCADVLDSCPSGFGCAVRKST